MCNSDIICYDCGGHGWGPMLIDAVWMRIVHHDFDGMYLCAPCMVKRLGRTLRRGDLVDCPMNHHHEIWETINA